jgi:ParB-like chromosome segregation protein Spo0J
MATDDITQTETETPTETPTETAADKAGADKATEALKAEAERLKKALAETNRKAQADRLRLADIDREAKEREDAKLGESERLGKRLKELEDQKREAEQRAAKLEADLLDRKIDQAIERSAAALFTHPEIASRLVDRARIVHDPDTDKISGIKDALEAVLKQYPGLGSAQRGGGSPAAMRTKRPEGGGTGGGGEKQDLRAEFARMGGYEAM